MSKECQLYISLVTLIISSCSVSSCGKEYDLGNFSSSKADSNSERKDELSFGNDMHIPSGEYYFKLMESYEDPAFALNSAAPKVLWVNFDGGKIEKGVGIGKSANSVVLFILPP